MKKLIFVAVTTAVALASACGSSSYTCCINGKFFNCNSADASSKCVQGDQSGCTADPSKDAPAGETTCKG